MDQRRIIYFLEPFPFPSGGVATAYRHVEILAENGIAAYVALREKPKIDFYGTSAPLLIGSVAPQRGDVCVIPEGFAGLARALSSTQAKRLMFCQNQYYLSFTENPPAGIAEFGVQDIVVSSVAVQSFFRDVYGIPDLALLPYAIDPKRFAAADHKRRQIALMPRKLPEETKFIAATFKRRYPRYADVPWIEIKGTTQAQAAKVMGESAVFLSLSHRESFGLPPLEAMACGCLVTGFHGDGGREYMTSENGRWAETGDWKTCVDGLAAAIALFDKGGSELDHRRQAAARTVERYSPSRLENTLISFWRHEISTPFA